MFKTGIHQGRFLAFVQAESFHVNRLDRAGNIETVEFGQFGIHIHGGGPGLNVDRFSAGCQVIWSPEGFFQKTWHDFFDPAVDAMHEAGQSLMPYMLVNKADVRN